MSFPIRYNTPPNSPAPELMTNLRLWSEWKLAVQLLRIGFQTPRLLQVSKGSNAPIFLIPGWKGPEFTMEPLRLYLKSRGHDARHWGFGTNKGDPEGDGERMIEKVSEVYAKTGQRSSLVGWSLGGVVARETARRLPECVSQVFTYGTPAVGGPTYTMGAHFWGDEECARVAKITRELDETNPISVPITAFFSKKDKVVSWPACIDRFSKNVTHYEVGSSHIGLIVDPDVWKVIGHQLVNEKMNPVYTKH